MTHIAIRNSVSILPKFKILVLSVLLLFGLLLGHNALNGFEEARAELFLLKHLGDRSKGNGLGYDGGGGHC